MRNNNSNNNNNNNIIETKKSGSNSMRRMQGRSCSRCHDAKNKRTEKRMEKNEEAGDRNSFFYAGWLDCLDGICCSEPACYTYSKQAMSKYRMPVAE